MASLPPLPRATANNRFELWKLGITHVLNAAHGGLYCQGNADFYGSSVSYLGVPAHDLPEFDISVYFSSAADFIHRALSTPGGRTWHLNPYSTQLSHGRMSSFPFNISGLPPLVFKKSSCFLNPLLSVPALYPVALLHRQGKGGLKYKVMPRVRSSPGAGSQVSQTIKQFLLCITQPWGIAIWYLDIWFLPQSTFKWKKKIF